MAVSQSAQKLNLATNFVALGKALGKAYADISRYNKIYVKSGVSFSAGDFDNTTLQFVDPTTLGTLITQLNAFVTWIDTSGNGDIFFRDSDGA